MYLRRWTSLALITLSALLLRPQTIQPLAHPDSTAHHSGSVVRVLTPPAALISALNVDARALSVPRRDIEARLVAAATHLAGAARPTSDPGSWVPAIAQLARGGQAHAAVAHALVTDVFERLHIPLDTHRLDSLLQATTAQRFTVDHRGAVAQLLARSRVQ